MHNTEEFNQRIEDCRELYLKHGGQNHELIEKEMRDLGYRDFHRRNLYRRFERGTCKPGWVETYGWNSLLPKVKPAKPDPMADANDNVCEDLESAMQPTFPQPIPADQLPDFDEFKNWLMRTWPGMTWEWKHQVYIYKHLKRVWDGDCSRLMIFLPPRHGKSELVTVRYPAWMLKHRPQTKIIIGSYNQRLANRFSRMVRSALAEDEFREKEASGDAGTPEKEVDFGVIEGDSGFRKRDETEFMNCGLGERSRSHDGGAGFSFRRANSEAEWETAEGGGVRAVGVGAGVTGYGANLIIIDDPVKSRAEAESETIRERVWDWFNDDIYTRLQPDGKIILIQTRWHEDDLAGRLLREAAEEGGEQWEVISLPALAEGMSPKGTKIIAQGKAEGRNPGYVNPNDIDPEGVEQTPRDVAPLQGADVLESCPGVTLAPLAHPRLLSLSPSATGEPQSTDPLGRAPDEALCPEWFDEKALDRVKRKLGSYSFAALYQQRPVPTEGGLFKRAWFRKIDSAPTDLKWKRGYDLGISKNSTSDYTASLRVAYDKAGNMYIDGGFRRRIEYPEQRRYILGRIAADSNTEHGIELSANGNAVIQDLRGETCTRGRALRGVKVKGDKVTNALPWIALAEEGKVFLVRGAWNSEFIDEAASFPSGTHDDQIDAVSIAVRMHRERSGRLYTF